MQMVLSKRFFLWSDLLDAVLEDGTVCTDALGDDRALQQGLHPG